MSLVQPLRDLFGRLINGALGAIAVPARTLFVSSAWPLGADPTLYFTDPNLAVAAAAAAGASEVNRYTVYCFGGNLAVFGGVIVGKPGVTLVCVDQSSPDGFEYLLGVQPAPTCNITAAISFTPVGAVDESFKVVGGRFSGAVTYNATGKTGGKGLLALLGVDVDHYTVSGRSGDAFEFSAGSIARVGSTAADIGSIFLSNSTSQFLSASAGNGRAVSIFAKNAFVVAPSTMTTAGSGTITVSNRSSTWGNILSAGTKAVTINSDASSIGAVTAAATVVVNRAITIDLLAATTGGGATDTYTMSNPQPDTAYNVILTPRSSAGGIVRGPVVTNKTTSTFDIIDPGAGAGGYDVTIVRAT